MHAHMFGYPTRIRTWISGVKGQRLTIGRHGTIVWYFGRDSNPLSVSPLLIESQVTRQLVVRSIVSYARSARTWRALL